jgi:hypothetical protein
MLLRVAGLLNMPQHAQPDDAHHYQQQKQQQ